MSGFRYTTVKDNYETAQAALLGKHEGEITKTSGATSSNGNAMLNIRVKIDDGSKADGETVFGRITFSANTFKMINGFFNAVDLDPDEELGDVAITEEFLSDWAPRLVGLRLGFTVKMSEPSEGYEARPEINPFSFVPAGSLQNTSSLLSSDL